jgi:hypothetical protein
MAVTWATAAKAAQARFQLAAPGEVQGAALEMAGKLALATRPLVRVAAVSVATEASAVARMVVSVRAVLPLARVPAVARVLAVAWVPAVAWVLAVPRARAMRP